jgi:uncharacterized protein YecT (DUF1311 family)
MFLFSRCCFFIFHQFHQNIGRAVSRLCVLLCCVHACGVPLITRVSEQFVLPGDRLGRPQLHGKNKPEKTEVEMKGAVFVLCGVLWLGFTFPAQAASFDCGKARTAVEKMICADAELSKLDKKMAAVYKPIDPRIAAPASSFSDMRAAYKQMPPYIADPVGYRMEQRDWLKSRNACEDAACVKQAYQTRLAAWRTLAQGPKPCFRLRERKWPKVQSGHYPVCVDVLKSMNKLCADIPLCEWKVDPSVPSLSLPQWEEINPKKHLKLIQHMFQTQSFFQAPEEQWTPIPPDVLQNIHKGKARLWRTWIDIDRDGQKEHVVKFSCNPCKEAIEEAKAVGLVSFHGGGTIYVADASMNRLDPRYSSLVGMDIVFHDNLAFVITMGGGITGDYVSSFSVEEPFSVREGSGKGKISVCVFDYLKR